MKRIIVLISLITFTVSSAIAAGPTGGKEGGGPYVCGCASETWSVNCESDISQQHCQELCTKCDFAVSGPNDIALIKYLQNLRTKGLKVVPQLKSLKKRR